MKLSKINETITEGFSRSDFFNMYLLLYASTEPQNRDDEDIQRLSKFYVDYILNDLIRQLTNICAERYFNRSGDFLKRQNYGEYEESSLDQLRSDPLGSKKKIAYFLQSVRDEATGGVWKYICTELLNAVNAFSHRDKVVAVDRLMNMLHHGGEIIDYLDEYSWLSQALDYRDNASPAQLARFASGQVRDVVGAVGGERGNIDPLRLLSTAIRRAASEYPNTSVSVDNNTIIIKCNGVLLKDSDEFGYGPDSIWFFAGGSKSQLAHRLGHDANAVKVAQASSMITGEKKSMYKRETLVFTDKFRSVKSVDLPIVDYYKLANYLVRWMVNVAESTEIQIPDGFWD